jgi:MauM/NapG family ferredoxin protein
VHTTSTAECIVCGNCVAIREGCSAFRFVRPTKDIVAADMHRRHVLAGLVGGAVALPALEASAMSARDHSGRLIRPPGSVPEEDFTARCIACGQCMKACPTNAIQPCAFHDGFHRLYTPKIAPRIGGCEEKCYLCGHVCPTGAIRDLTYEQKRFAKIGTAVIDRHRCLAWEQNKECLVCDEVCPYNAIESRLVETTTGLFRVPIVEEDLCLGCGLCEQHCPINDKAAIVVYRFGENRRADGAYVSAWRKEKILEQRKRSDSRHFGADNAVPQTAVDTLSESTDTTQPAQQGDLPPGFVE